MSSSGGNSTSDWQPPSWTNSTSESSLFGNPAEDGWGSEDTERPANTGGVQPNYAADYDTDVYSYTSAPPGYPSAAPAEGPGNAGYGAGNDRSGRSSTPSTDPDHRSGKPFFRSNLGGDSMGSSRSSSAPSGAIGSGVISVVVSIIFSQVGVFHAFIWFFIVFGAINTVRTLISKRGSRKANRICGGIGLALCIVAAIIQLVDPHSGPGAFWLFQLWSDRH